MVVVDPASPITVQPCTAPGRTIDVHIAVPDMEVVALVGQGRSIEIGQVENEFLRGPVAVPDFDGHVVRAHARFVHTDTAPLAKWPIDRLGVFGVFRANQEARGI